MYKNYEIYDKALAVIASCRTDAHIRNAKKYLELASKKLDWNSNRVLERWLEVQAQLIQ